MGLANAPSQFQTLMDLVLAGVLLEACLVYLYDVIIFSTSFEQHLQRLDAVLQRFLQAGLKLKPRKCQLFQERVHFLGHVVSADGVAPDPAKVEAVQQWPVPTSIAEVRSFLGLASYYRRFMLDFARIAHPLHALTAKGAEFVWTQKEEAGFYGLREALLSAMILATPTDGGTYYLDTDASAFGLGAVLQQEQDAHVRVIAYASRVVITALLVEKCSLSFLAWNSFVNFCLDKGLSFALTTQRSSIYLARLKLRAKPLAGWTFCPNMTLICSIELEPNMGIVMLFPGVLVHLTRRVIPVDNASPSWATRNLIHLFVCSLAHMGQLRPLLKQLSCQTLHEFAAQERDPDIGPLWKWKSQALSDADRPDRILSIQTQQLWDQRASLVMVDGVLCRCFENATEKFQQVVVPKELHGELLAHFHVAVAGVHLSARKMQLMLRQRVYWRGWKAASHRYVKECLVCRSAGSGPARKQGPLQAFEKVGPYHRLHIDLTGPHPASRTGHQYVLTALDACTRYLICVPLKDKTAVTVAHALVEHVFLPFGSSAEIVSDQGLSFAILSSLNFVRDFTSLV